MFLSITGDVRFGAGSACGGVISTPSLDRVAETGFSYANTHSTAQCFPTRVALVTGRNPHSAGFGVIS